MRTTVNIHDGLLETVKRRAKEHHRTLGDVIEDALRAYLATADEPREQGPPLAVFRRGGGALPGIDLTSNASIYDALGDEYDEFARQTRDGSS